MDFLTTYYDPLQFIILTIVVIAAAIIASLVYHNNPRSATNRIFTYLTLTTTLWLGVTYVVRLPELLPWALTLHRLGIFFAAPMSYCFFLLGHTMPSERILLSKRVFYASLAGTALMMLCNLSPYAFVSATIVNGVSEPRAGLGLVPFAVLSTLFSALAVYFLIRTYYRSRGDVQKQVGLILTGIFLMLSLVIFTILVPVIVFGSLMFLPFTPLYALAFLGLTAYAITRYHLFNVKVLLTQTLTAAIDIVLFAKIFAEGSTTGRLADMLVLSFMVVFGFFLVRSVKSEVRQRELIESQERELEASNIRLKDLDEQKSEFLSFASHQLRTPLTAIRWSTGAILDGSYGKVPEHLREPLQTIFEESSRMAVLVNDYLNLSRIEQGRMQYQFAPVNLVDVIKTVTTELAPALHAKGLTLEIKAPEDRVMIWGDSGKLAQVFSNVLDNSMKYTPKGTITITVKKEREAGRAHIEIHDTGIGIDKAEMPQVFKKFMRAEHAAEVNNTGSGLGLFIVKTFVEAHKGSIHPESEGLGKGTTFVIDLPLLVQNSAPAPEAAPAASA